MSSAAQINKCPTGSGQLSQCPSITARNYTEPHHFGKVQLVVREIEGGGGRPDPE